MPLKIETYSNVEGGNSFYKAISHPHTANKINQLIKDLSRSGPVAVYDPLNFFIGFAEFYNLSEIKIVASFVQTFQRIGSDLAGCKAQPITDFPSSNTKNLFIMQSSEFKDSFEMQKYTYLEHLI